MYETLGPHIACDIRPVYTAATEAAAKEWARGPRGVGSNIWTVTPCGWSRSA